MNKLNYILKHRRPIPCDDLIKWGKWFNQSHKRRVRSTYINNLWISTVFLGIDHQWGDGPPLLFETMLFNQHEEEPAFTARCTTWREALRQHRDVITHIKTKGNYYDGRD